MHVWQRGVYDVNLYKKVVDGKATYSGASSKDASTVTLTVKVAVFDDGKFALVDHKTHAVQAEFTLEEWMKLSDDRFERVNSPRLDGNQAKKHVEPLRLPILRPQSQELLT